MKEDHMRRPPSARTFPKYPVTSATIALAVALTLVWWSNKADVSQLFVSAAIRRGELWRLLTSTLLHGDGLHLIFNVYWTWVFGTLVEEAFGHYKTLAIFLFLAFVANGAEYALLEGGVGLSGVGYGLFAVLWVLSRRTARFAGMIDQQTVVLFVAWFFLCIFLTYQGHPIANIAHAAGAGAGALLGWALSSPRHERLRVATAVSTLTVTVVLAVTVARPWINFSKSSGYEEAQLGYEDLVAGRNEKAVRWLCDATHMRPGEAIYWFNLGIAYERLNRRPQSIQAFQRASEIDPSNTEYLAALRQHAEHSD